METLEEKPWAEFADRLARELIEHDISEAAIVTRSDGEERVVTNYFGCNYEKRCVLIGHMITDLVMEIIDINRAWVREILEDEEEDDGDSDS